MPCCRAKASIEAYFDRFLLVLFCTSWSRVNTSCEGFLTRVAPMDLNLYPAQLSDHMEELRADKVIVGFANR